jgi:hypothetical protein
MLTREEIKRRQSIGGQKGAETRWGNNAQNTPKPNYHELPDPLITWHVDGKFWQETGWTKATVKIRKSCKQTPLYIQ